jgi:hypothetical protein
MLSESAICITSSCLIHHADPLSPPPPDPPPEPLSPLLKTSSALASSRPSISSYANDATNYATHYAHYATNYATDYAHYAANYAANYVKHIAFHMQVHWRKLLYVNT